MRSNSKANGKSSAADLGKGPAVYEKDLEVDAGAVSETKVRQQLP